MIHSLSRSSGSKTLFFIVDSWHILAWKISENLRIPLTNPKPSRLPQWPHGRSAGQHQISGDGGETRQVKQQHRLTAGSHTWGYHNQKTSETWVKQPKIAWFIMIHPFWRWSPEWIGQNSEILQCLGEILWNPVTTSGLADFLASGCASTSRWTRGLLAFKRLKRSSDGWAKTFSKTLRTWAQVDEKVSEKPVVLRKR